MITLTASVSEKCEYLSDRKLPQFSSAPCGIFDVAIGSWDDVSAIRSVLSGLIDVAHVDTLIAKGNRFFLATQSFTVVTFGNTLSCNKIRKHNVEPKIWTDTKRVREITPSIGSNY